MTPRFSMPEISSVRSHEAIPLQLKRGVGRLAMVAIATIGVPMATLGIEVSQSQPAAAVENNYPDADAYDCSASFGVYSWCKGGSWLSPRGFAYRNCTDWAAARTKQITGVDVPAYFGNAGTWDDNAAGRFSVDNSPEPGNVAVWDGDANNPYGHVAIVESVNPNGTVNVSEYNQTGQGTFSERSSVIANHYVDFYRPPAPAVSSDTEALRILFNSLWTQSGAASLSNLF